ncbi:MAG: FkbM family methyltransferase [Zoogloeaceae bacterium]|nr:FkbM family methyltransferase [Zoogloeaceae bacterium]
MLPIKPFEIKELPPKPTHFNFIRYNQHAYCLFGIPFLKRRDGAKRVSYRLFGFPILITWREDLGSAVSVKCYRFFRCFTIRRPGSLKAYLRALNMQMLQLCNKISLQNNQDVIELPCGTKFYVPFYPGDSIQRFLVEERRFFEQEMLDDLQRYLPEGSTILDIGANLGNHSLYWAIHSGAKRIHSFEPLPMTYRVLQENIRLNGLEETIVAHHLGLGDKNEHVLIAAFKFGNLGGTSFESAEQGEERRAKTPFKFVTLDSLALNEEKIHFVKIDAEGFELQVLTGAHKTLLTHKPILFIEAFRENAAFVKDFCSTMGYQTPISYPHHNYLFLPQV